MAEDRIKTSIKIKPSLWKEAKKQAIEKNTTVSKLVEEALTSCLKE